MTRALGGFDPKANYSAAAEQYERASERYWRFLSIRTVDRLRLGPGQAVLDAACGTAPATIAAARQVAPGGRVVGVDYAEGMLAVARRNLAASGVTGVELVQGDLLALPYGPVFDAVVSVLGIFFVDDMAAAARALWSHVRPGGVLAVTTFGGQVWEPMLQHFVESARRARPDIEIVVPWRRTLDPAVLETVFRDAGIPDAEVVHEMEEIPFHVEDWRTIVMGSGLRRIAGDLGPEAEDVLAGCERWARERNLTAVRIGTNYATARKAA